MNVITASDVTTGAIKDAYAKAAYGDTVQVPPGDGDIEDILGAAGVALVGSGKDQTQLRLAAGVQVYLGDDSRITAMEILLEKAARTDSNSIITGIGQRSRADHLRVINKTGIMAQIACDGRPSNKHPMGVVDHNEMYDVRHLPFGTGDDNWSAPSTIGVNEQPGVWVVENNFCKFTIYSNVIDSELTARYVFRKNHVIGAWAEAHSNQGTRNARSWELYDNFFEMVNNWFTMFLRGGTGVVFNNTIKRNGPDWHPFIGLDNVFMGPYPMKDQIGRGRDLTGGGQELEPAYFWNNKFEDGTDVIPVVVNGFADLIQVNRDYYLSARPSYTPSQYPYQLIGGAVEPTPDPSDPMPVPPDPIPVPPDPIPSTLKAVYVGEVDDLVGSFASGPSGVKDWKINLTGVRSDPVRTMIDSSQPGHWELPFNGTNWTMATQFKADGTGSLQFEPYGAPGAFKVTIKYGDGTSDQCITTTEIPVPPDPVPPPVNKPPTVSIKLETTSGTPINPSVPITVKNVKVKVVTADDVGPVQNKLLINGLEVYTTTDYTFTYSWNTAPYKGKQVELKAVSIDADSAKTTVSVLTSVKK